MEAVHGWKNNLDMGLKGKKIVTFFGLGSDFQLGRPGYLRLGLIHDLEESEAGLIS